MEVKSKDYKTAKLSDNGVLLGELVYKNMFLFKAELRMSNGDRYKIEPVGFFGTSIAVTQNSKKIASMKMNWKGQIIFEFQDGREFVMKSKTLLSNKYLIENKEGESLMLFEPSFNWKKFNYNYKISYEKKPKDTLLVLLGLYATNYIINCMSGASSGMG